MRRAIVHPLPVGLVVDGEVVNADELAVELRALFTEHKLPQNVRVGLAHPRLMVRMVELPASLSGRDLDGAVHHMASDLLPVGLDQLVVDYRCVGKSPEGNGPPQQRVLMAAARVDGIERLNRALAGAHLRADRIQLSGLAMLAALEHPPLGGEAILYVQAGALTNVVIAEDGEPLLVRAASAGSESIAQGLAERTGITHEEARGHIAAMGVQGAPPTGSAVKPELEAAITLQVREGLRRVIAEIESSRSFYSARADARPIGGVVLTGAMTTWPGVAELLREELNVPVLPAGRDSWPDLGTVSVSPERLDVAVGLALAADNERPDLRPVRAGSSAAGRIDAAPNARVAQVAAGVMALVAIAVVYMVIVSNQVSSRQGASRDARHRARPGRAAGRGAEAVRRLRQGHDRPARGGHEGRQRALQLGPLAEPAVEGRPRRRLAEVGQGHAHRRDAGRGRRRDQRAARRPPRTRPSNWPAVPRTSATCRGTWTACTRCRASRRSASAAPSAARRRRTPNRPAPRNASAATRRRSSSS